MGQNLLQANGGQAQKPTHFVSLFTSRFLTGLYTNRNLLRGPMQYIYSDFYHLGSTDALCDGLNSELSIRQTMIRRPGNPKYCTVLTDSAVDSFYSFHEANGMISVIADTVAKVDVVTPTTLTNIFTKAAGSGESYFQGINNSLYITDGIDLVKYIPNEPGNLNPQLPSTPLIWNFSAPAPLTAITTQITQTGSSGVAWVASTMWTTMGLLLDSNGNVQQITSVNALGGNTTQLGMTGNGAPAFSLTPGNSVVESAGTPITWTNWGQIVVWTPGMQTRNYSHAPTGATLNTPCIIYDPGTNQCYAQINGGSGVVVTASTTKPNFTPTIGWTQTVGAAKWAFFDPKLPSVWKPSTSYPTFGGGSDALKSVVTPCTIPQAAIGTANATTIYLQVSSGGTSAPVGTYTPQWATGVGNSTIETGGGNIIWNCLGSATRLNNATYTAWSAGSNNFSVIYDGANFQVCIASTGPSASAPPSFATVYGNATQDGVNPGTSSFVGVTWACVGQSLAWAASTQWYLPTGGFVPPQPSQPYGGATLSEAGVNQYVINSGKSQTPGPPSWAALFGTTTDGGVTWRAASLFTAVGFSWTKGMGYTYALKSRTSADVSVLTAPPLQIPGTNSPNITGPLGPPVGAGDGTVTTAAPVVQITGSNAGAQILLTIAIPPGGFDPQFDTISIYRSADGFGASGPYLWLTDIPIPPIGTLVAQIIDFMPDLPTNLLPGLNPLITAPIDHANDPPPGAFGSTQFVAASSATPTTPLLGTAMIGQVYHQGRLWGFIGNTVFASGGPDTNPGNGMTAWPPDNEFPFDSPVVLLVPTASALIVFTTTDILLIGGGPAITDYYSQLLAPGIGIVSPNAVSLIVGLPHLFTSDRQFIVIDPAGGFTRLGHPIGDKLVAYNPSNVYVTFHSYGDLDHAIYVANGSSEWYRCDPNPTPDSQLTGPVWSPRATILDGFKAIQSIEVSAGTKKLLIGPSAAGYILSRDSTFATFQDNGFAYESYFTMGNIVLAHPGQMAQTAFIEMDFVKTGSQPKVQVLFDELGAFNGAAFETISNSFVSDPPKKYGQTATPNTLWMNRYYFGQTTPTDGEVDQTPLPAWCKFLQLKVDFGNTDTVENELLAFSIFGALFQEK